MIARSSRTESAGTGPPPGTLLGGVAGGILALFLLAPWPLEEKAHAALHGLCAQIPTHAYYVDGKMLPFDARMTGIYGGFAVAFAYLALRHRLRSVAVPPPRVCAALAAFVAVMAVDGTNSLLLDLGLPHAYAPRNELRLATGLLTGISLAAATAYLLAASLWRRPDERRACVGTLGELAWVATLTGPFALAVAGGPGWLYPALSVGLLVSAVAVVTLLALVVVAMLRGRDGTFDRIGQLERPALIALLAGLAVMAGIAGGRFWLEALTGVRMVAAHHG